MSLKPLPREQWYGAAETDRLAIEWIILACNLLGRLIAMVTEYAPSACVARNKESDARGWGVGGGSAHRRPSGSALSTGPEPAAESRRPVAAGKGHPPRPRTGAKRRYAWGSVHRGRMQNCVTAPRRPRGQPRPSAPPAPARDLGLSAAHKKEAGGMPARKGSRFAQPGEKAGCAARLSGWKSSSPTHISYVQPRALARWRLEGREGNFVMHWVERPCRLLVFFNPAERGDLFIQSKSPDASPSGTYLRWFRVTSLQSLLTPTELGYGEA